MKIHVTIIYRGYKPCLIEENLVFKPLWINYRQIFVIPLYFKLCTYFNQCTLRFTDQQHHLFLESFLSDFYAGPMCNHVFIIFSNVSEVCVVYMECFMMYWSSNLLNVQNKTKESNRKKVRNQRNIYDRLETTEGACSSVVVKALSYKPEGRGITSRWGGFFLIYLILPAALGPGVDSVSNRNKHQESLKKKPGGKVRPARRADNLATIS
jgi:hypothetical protein